MYVLCLHVFKKKIKIIIIIIGGTFYFIGRGFHNAAVNVLISLFSYHIVLLQFGTSDVVERERSSLAREYQ